MGITFMQFLTATIMVAAVVALVFAYRRYLAMQSERRMLGMLTSLGLDPTIATSGDIETIMGEVRERCRHCGAEDKCERWLKGEEEGENDFCPNHRVIEILGKYSGASG
jgi:hypothetical protein